MSVERSIDAARESRRRVWWACFGEPTDPMLSTRRHGCRNDPRDACGWLNNEELCCTHHGDDLGCGPVRLTPVTEEGEEE